MDKKDLTRIMHMYDAVREAIYTEELPALLNELESIFQIKPFATELRIVLLLPTIWSFRPYGAVSAGKSPFSSLMPFPVRVPQCVRHGYCSQRELKRLKTG
jgi:hypothetical protein